MSSRYPAEHWARECDASLRRSRARRRHVGKRDHAIQILILLVAISVAAAIIWRTWLIFSLA